VVDGRDPDPDQGDGAVVDWKGVACFLAITFGITYAIEGALILAGWIHGAFNGQAYGVWRILFPAVDPLLGGMTGLLAMVTWLVVGAAEVRRGGVAGSFPPDGLR